MKINTPCIITPRLLPGIEIGGAMLSISYARRRGDGGRTRYHWFIDLAGETFDADDMQSGNSGGDLQDGLSTLLTFLSAAGEAINYETRTGRKSDNADLFPPAVAQWAAQYSDEISAADYELEMNTTQDEEPYIIDEDA